MDLALIIDDTINQYKHKTPMPLKSKFKKIFDDAWGKAHLMQMEDLPAEEKYAFSLFYKKANDTMTEDVYKRQTKWSVQKFCVHIQFFQFTKNSPALYSRFPVFHQLRCCPFQIFLFPRIRLSLIHI